MLWLEFGEVEIIMGYKKDTTDAYKSMNSYYDQYQPYLIENKLYSDMTFDEFKDDLKGREGNAQRYQKFLDLMREEGMNVGQASKILNMSFDEISIAIEGATINCSHLGSKYNE